ncbi:hypothetical protein ACHAPJ_002994 [Fusarium lateritium]
MQNVDRWKNRKKKGRATSILLFLLWQSETSTGAVSVTGEISAHHNRRGGKGSRAVVPAQYYAVELFFRAFKLLYFFWSTPRVKHSSRRTAPAASFDEGIHGEYHYLNTLSPINQHSDLGTGEKLDLFDLLASYIEFRQIEIDDNGPNTVKRIKGQFYGEVFQFWASGWPFNDRPILRARVFSDAAIEVGKLKQDHPGSKRGRDGEISPARRSNQPVYYKLVLTENGEYLHLICCDKNSSPVAEAYVDFKEKLTAWEYLYRAIRHYDYHERARVTEYNLAQIIQAAHRRIFKWVKNGINGDHFCAPTDAEDRIRGFEPLLLAKDFLAQTTQTQVNLLERLNPATMGKKSRKTPPEGPVPDWESHPGLESEGVFAKAKTYHYVRHNQTQATAELMDLQRLSKFFPE